jgi:hypothetical protein
MSLWAAESGEAQGCYVFQEYYSSHPLGAGSAGTPGRWCELNFFRFQNKLLSGQTRTQKAGAKAMEGLDAYRLDPKPGAVADQKKAAGC